MNHPYVVSIDFWQYKVESKVNHAIARARHSPNNIQPPKHACYTNMIKATNMSIFLTLLSGFTEHIYST